MEGAAATKVDTGNAHSLQPRSIKVRALKASVCSLLRDVASVVRVAVCDDDDKRVVEEALGTMADVVVVPCGSKPRNLPFLALHDAVSNSPTRRSSRSPSRTYLALRLPMKRQTPRQSYSGAPASVLTPHRWHKRCGSTAEKGRRLRQPADGPCQPCSLRAGARMAAVARMPG